MSIKTKRHLVAFGYHAGVLTFVVLMARIGTAIGSQGIVGASALILLGHILTFRAIPISRWVQEMLIPEATCYGCGAAIELVGLYRCGCGFVSHKERHAFSPCPMCGKNYSWFVCPECETSLPV
jgi:hypothetical protein